MASLPVPENTRPQQAQQQQQSLRRLAMFGILHEKRAVSKKPSTDTQPDWYQCIPRFAVPFCAAWDWRFVRFG